MKDAYRWQLRYCIVLYFLYFYFSPDSFPRNLPLSLTDSFRGFYAARVRKSLALKTLVSAAVKASSVGFWAHFKIVYLLTYLLYCIVSYRICYIIFEYAICRVSESEKLDDQEEYEVGFERTPKPMLPYSALFVFGPTNP